VTLSLLSIHVDRSYLSGQLHHEGGIVFFLLSLGLMAPVLFLLVRSERHRTDVPAPRSVDVAIATPARADRTAR
jgi:hypothetical protein